MIRVYLFIAGKASLIKDDFALFFVRKSSLANLEFAQSSEGGKVCFGGKWSVGLGRNSILAFLFSRDDDHDFQPRQREIANAEKERKAKRSSIHDAREDGD